MKWLLVLPAIYLLWSTHVIALYRATHSPTKRPLWVNKHSLNLFGFARQLVAWGFYIAIGLLFSWAAAALALASVMLIRFLAFRHYHEQEVASFRNHILNEGEDRLGISVEEKALLSQLSEQERYAKADTAARQIVIGLIKQNE